MRSSWIYLVRRIGLGFVSSLVMLDLFLQPLNNCGFIFNVTQHRSFGVEP